MYVTCIFSVASPTSTRITVITQKRTITSGLRPALELEVVVQGRHSKDAFAGELERRRPARITDTVSITNTPPMISSTSS